MTYLGRRKKTGSKRNGSGGAKQNGRFGHTYAALDLGTNNCRLLIARPKKVGFQVIDSFSRTVRLGEGLEKSGVLSEDAIDRTVDALQICSDKLRYRRVTKVRAIATQACRLAENGEQFIERVREETSIPLDIIRADEEAKLAVAGCSTLLDRSKDAALIFDIGGGSTELVWLDLTRLNQAKSGGHERTRDAQAIVAWTSLPFGVVNLAERYGGRDIAPQTYEAMITEVGDALDAFSDANFLLPAFENGCVQMLGTSGTVTTLAGIYLGLERYDRSQVDGIWLDMPTVRDISDRLASLSYEDRKRVHCVGEDRADLVVAGCAILEAIYRRWPCESLRVADRGLREGMLLALMDEADREGARRSSRGKYGKGRSRRPGTHYRPAGA